ncbi:MAG: aldo/keto reductase [Lachnospiraceae bacterium]|nr:aldo/keto reductase [Lachnospiraceae bacterium]
MRYKNITDIKLPVSRMVFGTATPAMMSGEPVFELLDTAFAAGINTFDSARIYGEAEKILGEWMIARGNREQIVLMTKGAHPLPDSTEVRVTPEVIYKDVKESLKMLQTDFIDVYMLHRDNPKKPVGPLVEVLNDLHEAGKIGVFGGSNWTVNRLEMANEYAYAHDLMGFSVSSPAYSLAEQIEDPWGGGCISISGEKQKKDRMWYREEGIEVFAYAALAHGFLSGKFLAERGKDAGKYLDKYAILGYCSPQNLECLKRAEKIAALKSATVPQVALAWLLNQPLAPMVLFSASTPERIQENVRAVDIELTQEDIQYLKEG